jgi:hypothetical protein
MQDPQEKLAQMYVEEYLRGKGQTMQTLLKLPEADAKRIMTEASTYAAMKLCEVERRAAIIHEIHGASQS